MNTDNEQRQESNPNAIADWIELFATLSHTKVWPRKDRFYEDMPPLAAEQDPDELFKDATARALQNRNRDRKG